MSKGFQQVNLHATSAFRAAFSLVELSIVLVILGLLAGGILTGQSLIRASQLRAIPVEFQQFQTATMAFQDKYRQLPGDMRNATDFWGAAAGPCATTAAVGAETCNGNGNGNIDFSGTFSAEQYRFWQHLANAGLIEGRFSGITGPNHTLYDSVTGYNDPASKFDNGSWHIFSYTAAYAANASLFDGIYYTHFTFGADAGSSNINNAPVLRPEEAWNIDKKIDDGMPAKGKLWSNHNNNCTTATASSDLDATYAVSLGDINCFFKFLVVF